MSWNLKFDEPIVLAKGKALRTLREAANHIISLPPLETKQQHRQTAMACLLSAAEKGGGLVTMARIAIVRALQGSAQSVPLELRRKPAK
jgi:hypothetical protein